LIAKGGEPPKVIVSFDDRGWTARRADGVKEFAAWDELESVEIRTTDDGPYLEDVFLVLRTEAGASVLPQGFDPFDALFERLQQLPGFDNSAVITAMGCADNAIFPCWNRHNTGGSA
jgi:hypothetical protein